MVLRSAMIPAATAGIVLLMIAGGRAETYRDDDHHFTMKLPQGWGRMPSDALATANEYGRMGPAPRSEYTAGFQQPSQAGAVAPIILVSVEPKHFGGMSLEVIDRELTQGLRRVTEQIKRALHGAGRNLSFGDIQFDRAKRRVTMRIQMDAADGTPFLGYCIGIVGKEALVVLYCNALEAESAERISAFDSIADSVQFDRGYEFVPRPDQGLSQQKDWGRLLLSGGMVGIIIGGMVALLFKLYRSSRAP